MTPTPPRMSWETRHCWPATVPKSRPPRRPIAAQPQVSILDRAGNAASLTVSNGEGCGVMTAPLAGMMLNNMLGEEDVNPRGFHNWPEDVRLSSMMAPTVVIDAAGGLTGFGERRLEPYPLGDSPGPRQSAQLPACRWRQRWRRPDCTWKRVS